MHVEENLAESTVGVFARAQVHFVPADHGFLSVAAATIRQFAALGEIAIDQSSRHLFWTFDGQLIG